jgi:Protein of unknown function (DUF2690).
MKHILRANSITRSAFLVMMGIMIASSLLLIPYGTAHAAALVSCSGSGCNGQYPVATGCNSDAGSLAAAEVRDSAYNIIGEVWLNWSSTCQTNWASAFVASGWTGTVTIYRNSGTDGGAEQYSAVVYPGANTDTRMVYAPHNTAYACLVVGSYSNCTPPH